MKSLLVTNSSGFLCLPHLLPHLFNSLIICFISWSYLCAFFIHSEALPKTPPKSGFKDCVPRILRCATVSNNLILSVHPFLSVSHVQFSHSSLLGIRTLHALKVCPSLLFHITILFFWTIMEEVVIPFSWKNAFLRVPSTVLAIKEPFSSLFLRSQCPLPSKTSPLFLHHLGGRKKKKKKTNNMPSVYPYSLRRVFVRIAVDLNQTDAVCRAWVTPDLCWVILYKEMVWCKIRRIGPVFQVQIVNISATNLYCSWWSPWLCR